MSRQLGDSTRPQRLRNATRCLFAFVKKKNAINYTTFFPGASSIEFYFGKGQASKVSGPTLTDIRICTKPVPHHARSLYCRRAQGEICAAKHRPATCPATKILRITRNAIKRGNLNVPGFRQRRDLDRTSWVQVIFSIPHAYPTPSKHNEHSLAHQWALPVHPLRPDNEASHVMLSTSSGRLFILVQTPQNLNTCEPFTRQNIILVDGKLPTSHSCSISFSGLENERKGAETSGTTCCARAEPFVSPPLPAYTH